MSLYVMDGDKLKDVDIIFKKHQNKDHFIFQTILFFPITPGQNILRGNTQSNSKLTKIKKQSL